MPSFEKYQFKKEPPVRGTKRWRKQQKAVKKKERKIEICILAISIITLIITATAFVLSKIK